MQNRFFFSASFRPRTPRAPGRFGVDIAEHTGPLDAIRGGRVLVLADAQNLDLSCRDLGYRLSWARLGQRLREAADRAWLHAVFSRSAPDESRRWDYFLERSWQPHAKIARAVNRPGGRVERDSNADFHLAFLAGHLAGRLSVNWVILATGDGTLALDVQRVSQQAAEYARRGHTQRGRRNGAATGRPSLRRRAHSAEHRSRPGRDAAGDGYFVRGDLTRHDGAQIVPPSLGGMVASHFPMKRRNSACWISYSLSRACWAPSSVFGQV